MRQVKYFKLDKNDMEFAMDFPPNLMWERDTID